MAGALSPATAEFGRRVRQARSAQGFSQEDFGHHCGLNRSYIGQVERGENNVTLHTMVRIAKALDTTLGDLLDGFDPEDHESYIEESS